jgi:type IV pilus assembly protein PilC
MRNKESIWNRDISSFFPSVTFTVKRKCTLRELAVFCRQLSLLLEAGIPVGQALAVMAGHTSSNKITADIRDRVTRGDGFSRALADNGAFPAFMSGLCLVGETAAKLPEVMNRLADYYEHRTQSKNELVSTLVYPAAVALMLIAVTVFTLMFILPQQARAIEAGGGEMPGITRALLTFAQTTADNKYLITAGLAALTVLVAAWSHGAAGKAFWSGGLLHISVYRLSVNVHISQSLYILLSAGRPLTEAMPVWRETMRNPTVREDIARLSRGLSEGRAFWKLLSEIKYIDPLLVVLARVGEETGRLAQSLGNSQRYLENRLTHSLRRWNKMVEPVVITVLGLIIGLVMAATLLPNFALLEAV